MKSLLEYMGISDIKSPRAAIREGYAYGLIGDGEQWIDMMIDCNKTSHLYDADEAKLIYYKIKNQYTIILTDLNNTLEQEIGNIR